MASTTRALRDMEAPFRAYLEQDKGFHNGAVEAINSMGDKCFVVEKVPNGGRMRTIRIRFYDENRNRRSISMRTAYYFIYSGKMAGTMPRSTCEDGCVNPAHQVVIDDSHSPSARAIASARRTMERLMKTSDDNGETSVVDGMRGGIQALNAVATRNEADA